MPRIGLSITKSTAFRNSTQEFSNVYYFELSGNLPSQAEAAALIDEQVAKEKPLHAPTATFIRGRLWSETGNKATSEMIEQHSLSGVGTGSESTSMDKERAFLFRIRAGSDSRGNPVYLRKWFHAMGSFGGVTVSAGILQGVSGFTQANRDQMVAAMRGLGSIGAGAVGGTICAKSGRRPTALADWQAHQFLEHHQFGDQWRAN